MAKRASRNARANSGAGKGRARGGESRAKAAAGTKKSATKSSSGGAGAARGGSKRAAAKPATGARPRVKGLARTGAKSTGQAGASRPSRRAVSRKATSRTSKLGRVAVVVGGAAAGVVGAVARTVLGRRADDAISLLERDHRRLEDLLERAEETTPAAVRGRGELLDAITSELRGHEMIEERVFYPALREHPEAKDLVLEGFEEHHAVDVAVKELRGLSPGAEQWAPKLKVVQEMIQHHIEEEEGEMFRTARAVLGRDELAALGRRMAAMKAKAPSA